MSAQSIITRSREQEIAFFLSFCIEQYKSKHNLSGTESMQKLREAGILDYLAENYAILHTQNSHWLLEEIEELLSQKETA